MRLITLTTLLGAGLALPLDTELNNTPLARRDGNPNIFITDISGTSNPPGTTLSATVGIPNAGISTHCSASNFLGFLNSCDDKRVKISISTLFHWHSQIKIKFDGTTSTFKFEFECQANSFTSFSTVQVRPFYPLLCRN